jgi:hypothetical protein
MELWVVAMRETLEVRMKMSAQSERQMAMPRPIPKGGLSSWCFCVVSDPDPDTWGIKGDCSEAARSTSGISATTLSKDISIPG